MPTKKPGAVYPTFIKPTGELRWRLAIPTLKVALELIRRDGWCQGVGQDETGRWSLYGALAWAGGGRIQSEYARDAVRDVLWRHDLQAWNNDPARRKAEVLRVLQKAITRRGVRLSARSLAQAACKPAPPPSLMAMPVPVPRPKRQRPVRHKRSKPTDEGYRAFWAGYVPRSLAPGADRWERWPWQMLPLQHPRRLAEEAALRAAR